MPVDDVFDFQCPHCSHRLKAKVAAAGRRAKCSKCQQLLRVPAPQSSVAAPQSKVPAPPVLKPMPPSNVSTVPRKPAALPAIDKDDWLNLGEPAIADLSDRQKEYESHKEAKERERLANQHKQQQRKRSSAHTNPTSPEPIGKLDRSTGRDVNQPPPRTSPVNAAEEGDPEDVFRLVPFDSSDPRTAAQKPKPPAAREHEPKRSVFDDDLPELSDLQPNGKPSRKIDELLAAHAGEDFSLSDPLAPLVPNLEPPNLESLPKANTLSKTKLANQTQDPEYRVSCSACGTTQYVRLSQKGKAIKCPDCFLQFQIPAPPHGWIPDAQAQQRARENDWHTSNGNSLQAADPQAMQRSRTSRMLEKAEQQVSDEDLDRLYDGDFDTADFVQRTFGFLKDPVAIAYIFGYAIVFAIIFAAAQFAANEANTPHGKGVLLAVVIGAPVVGLLFTMPMLSGGIALIESVANRQKRVADWPGFNLFDNAGDMLAITTALLGSVIPGFLVGAWLGGDEQAAGRIQIAGMMTSSFILFPVFLLSMLDNGSLFAPMSSSILHSFRDASEAWGGYFLKTFIAFAIVMLLWLLLLGEGKHVALAALGGCLLPLLVFFTCQQIGALADSISENLSFEFVAPGSKENDEAQV